MTAPGPGARAFADAVHETARAKVAGQDSQQALVKAVDPAARTVTVEYPAGLPGNRAQHPYLAPYNPQAGDLVWVEGTSDARYVAGRVDSEVRAYELSTRSGVIELVVDHGVGEPYPRVSITHRNPDGSYMAGSAIELIVDGAGSPGVSWPTDDLAVFADDGRLVIRNPTNTAYRGLAMGTANIDLLYVNGITCYFSFSANTVLTNGLTVNGNSNLRDIHQEGFGLFTGGIISTGNVQAPTFNGNPSSRALKKDIRPAPERHLAVVRGAPLHQFRYRKGAVAGADHTTLRRGWMADDLPADALVDTDDGPAPELIGMLRYAWGSTAELADQFDEQTRTITDLTAQVAALTARLDALEAR